MFNFIKEKIKNVYQSFTTKINQLFSRANVDHDFLRDLEKLFLSADTGVATTRKIITELKAKLPAVSSSEQIPGEQVHQLLKPILKNLLAQPGNTDTLPPVIIFVGINGSGKTTTVGKLAAHLTSQGKRIMVVAGDTFRAAATEQLETWASRSGSQLFMGRENQDPASLVFDACAEFSNGSYDHIIIDTAGRLQTKVNLMRELEKIKKIITRKLPDTETATWITIDSMLGQNSLVQARQFHEATDLTGVVLTKCDGTGKGGIMFAISDELNLPIMYMTLGEQIGDIKPFNPDEYVDNLLSGE